MRFKEITAGIRSCFSLTANERLIIILIAAILLTGLALRWLYLARERPTGYAPAAGQETTSPP